MSSDLKISGYIDWSKAKITGKKIPKKVLQKVLKMYLKYLKMTFFVRRDLEYDEFMKLMNHTIR